MGAQRNGVWGHGGGTQRGGHSDAAPMAHGDMEGSHMGTQRKDTPMLPLWHMETRRGHIWGHRGGGDTPMLPLWHMGTQTGDVWGHGGLPYWGHRGRTPRCCPYGTWGHRQVMYGDTEGSHTGTQRGGHPDGEAEGSHRRTQRGHPEAAPPLRPPRTAAWGHVSVGPPGTGGALDAVGAARGDADTARSHRRLPAAARR